MKKTYTILSIGTGLMVALTSCQSSNQDYPGGYEEATPMSELAVGDGELPPWVLEDNEDSDQVPAGDYTDHAIVGEPEVRNTDSGASQNQPEVAEDDTIVEDIPEDPVPTPVATTTPIATTPVGTTTAAGTTIAPKPPKKVKPKPVVTKPRNTTDRRKLSARERRSVKRVKKPTLITYKVRPGDNLTVIARRSNTTVEQIRKDSNIQGDLIRPGQIIKVRYYPKGTKPTATRERNVKPTTHTVKRGESISVIAKRNGLTTAELLRANNMTSRQADRLQAGRKLVIPHKGGSTSSNQASSTTTANRSHTVRKGETISAIAQRNGVTTAQLLKANNMTMAQAARVRPGAKLTIPGKTTTKKNTKKSRRR